MLYFVALEPAFAEANQEGRTPPKTLFALGWKVEGLSSLLQSCKHLLVEVATLTDKCSSHHDVTVSENIFTELRSRLTTFIKSVSRLEQTPAANLYVLMISSEQRNTKLYAVPIQCIPYSSLQVCIVRYTLKLNFVRLH